MGCKGSRVQISALRPIKSNTSEHDKTHHNARGTVWGRLCRGPATPVPETRTIDPRCANNAYLSLGPYATDQNGPERSDTHVWRTHLTATWQLDPSFTVKSITAYRETQPDSICDADRLVCSAGRRLVPQLDILRRGQ